MPKKYGVRGVSGNWNRKISFRARLRLKCETKGGKDGNCSGKD